MKRKLKIALVGATLLAATGIGAGLVVAGDGETCGQRTHMMRSAWKGDFKAIATARLDRLHGELKLRKDQEPAWAEFSTSVSGQAAQIGEKAKSMRDAAASTTAVERLERLQKGLDDGRLALEQLTTATKRFYGTLDKEQQARFDELTRHLSSGKHGWGSHGKTSGRDA